MKNRKKLEAKRDILLSLRITKDQQNQLQARQKKKGFASVSQYVDQALFPKQKGNDFEYSDLQSIMLLKNITDVKLKLILLSRVYIQDPTIQEKLNDIYKTLLKCYDDTRR